MHCLSHTVRTHAHTYAHARTHTHTRTRRDAGAWLQSWAPMRDMPQAERLQLLLEENQWKNDLVMWVFPPQLRAAMPHFVQTWVRCGLLCAAVYMAMSCLWTYYIYYCFGDKLFQPGKIPAFKDVLEQLKVGRMEMRLARRQLSSVEGGLRSMRTQAAHTRLHPRTPASGAHRQDAARRNG